MQHCVNYGCIMSENDIVDTYNTAWRGFFLQLFVTQSSPTMPLQDLPLRIAFASWKSTPWLMIDWSQLPVANVSMERTCAPWTFHTVKQRTRIKCQNVLSNCFGLVLSASWYFDIFGYYIARISFRMLQSQTTNQNVIFHWSHRHHIDDPMGNGRTSKKYINEWLSRFMNTLGLWCCMPLLLQLASFWTLPPTHGACPP